MVEPAEPAEPVEPGDHVEPVEPDDVPLDEPLDEPRRYPSTIGGAFYLLVLGTAVVAIAIVATSDWRLGVRVLASGLGAAGVLRLVLPQRDAGMLAVYKNGARLGQAVAPGMRKYDGSAVAGLKGQELCWAVSLWTTGAAVRVASKPLPTA